MIADRMGQFNATTPGDARLLEQAKMLFLLAGEMDHASLDIRIRAEAPDYDLNYLETCVDDSPPSQYADLPVQAPRATEGRVGLAFRSAEHTSEFQSLMRISYAVICLKK